MDSIVQNASSDHRQHFRRIEDVERAILHKRLQHGYKIIWALTLASVIMTVSASMLVAKSIYALRNLALLNKQYVTQVNVLQEELVMLKEMQDNSKTMNTQLKSVEQTVVKIQKRIGE